MKTSTIPRLLLGWMLLISSTLAAPAQSSLRPRPELANDASKLRSIVVLGDSLAAGFGVDPSEAFPAVLQQKVDQADWPFRVVNAGVSGDTTAGGLRRINWLLKRKIDVLLIELGGNDGLRGIPLKSVQANLQGIIDRTKKRYPKARIVIAGMRMPPNMGEAYTRPFQQIFHDLAKKNKTALIPFLLEGVGGKPEMNLPDQIHPTAAGHRRLAENAWKTLKPLLQKLQSANRH